MKTFLLLGYTGRKVSDLLAFAEGTDAAIVDVRFAARSRNPQYNHQALQDALGDRYVHVRDWGNVNYKGGPVKIENFEAGLAVVKELPFERCILMCACSDPVTCHRTQVGWLLSNLGYEVVEVGTPNLQLPLY